MSLVALDRSPYLEGPYAPVAEESVSRDLRVKGELPADLLGTFVRNGANPKLPPKGRYHWFDGDGMIHALEIRDGKATYRNRFVRTDALVAESEAGGPLWTGILEPPDLGNPKGPFKNTANTDLVFHAGKLLALWWQSGAPYVISLPDLETCGKERFGGAHKAGISAHPKVDPRTGEMMFITFRPFPPYLSYGVIDPNGHASHYVAIESIPGPRYQHDIAITERFTILMDLPMRPDMDALARGKSRVRFHRDEPARFGVIPRRGTDADIRWFDADPCYIYHTINAWEEGDEVVLIGCRMADPLVGDPSNPKDDRTVPTIGFQRLEPYLHEWRMNLVTGKLTERRVGDTLLEFPRMDNRVLGKKSRYSYSPRVMRAPTVLFDAVVKHDHETGRETVYEYPKGWFGGEIVVCPREGSQGEDDAYLVTFVIEAATGKSEAYVWSARELGEPLARVEIPVRVPIGYHAWWVPAGPAASSAASNGGAS
jgi:carotenoid cleavage dioxygenase